MIFDVKKDEIRQAAEIIENKHFLFRYCGKSFTKNILLKLGALNGAKVLVIIRVIRRKILKIH